MNAVVLNKKQHMPETIRNEIQMTDSAIEIVEVKDEKRGQKHYLLIETKRTSSCIWADGKKLHEVADIDIRARYLFGDRINHIGHLVSHMGGRLSYDQTVKLTNGEVMVKLYDLHGLHIGTYLFHKVVHWAKGFDPGCRVVPISLSRVDAKDPENKKRRNRFYENFGLRFNYRSENGIEDAEGASDRSLTVGDLIAYQNWPNIRACHWLDGFKAMAYAFDKLRRDRRANLSQIRFMKRQATMKDRWLLRLSWHLNWLNYGIIAAGAFWLGKQFG